MATPIGNRGSVFPQLIHDVPEQQSEQTEENLPMPLKKLQELEKNPPMEIQDTERLMEEYPELLNFLRQNNQQYPNLLLYLASADRCKTQKPKDLNNQLQEVISQLNQTYPDGCSDEEKMKVIQQITRC